MGDYFADILVENVLVVEIKCAQRLSDEHLAQCLNYLRVSGRTLCLLINFQKPKVEWKRVVNGEARYSSRISAIVAPVPPSAGVAG